MSRRYATAAVLTLAPTAARAHSPIAGIEGFYAGLVHPLTSANQLLALLAIGVMLSLPASGRPGAAWAAFAVGAVAGIAWGQIAGAPTVEAPLLLVAAAAAGLSALRPPGIPMLALALAALGGVLIGNASTPDPGPLRPTIITLAGCFVGANLTLVYAAGATAWLRRFHRAWVLIGLRIVSAWIAAVAVLMAALAYASG